jgi:predicted RNase H-like HicB family nuclease
LVKFEVCKDGKWWGARALGHGIFTQARTLDQLYRNIKEAAHLHFEEEVEKGEKLEIVIIADAEVRGGRKVAAASIRTM